MIGANTILTVSLLVGASATLSVAHLQGWGSLGTFDQSLVEMSSCKPHVQSVAWSTGAGSRSLAETKALVDWSEQARHHGNIYSSWHNARARDVICKRLHGKTTKCTVTGRPCQQKAEINRIRMF